MSYRPFYRFLIAAYCFTAHWLSELITFADIIQFYARHAYDSIQIMLRKRKLTESELEYYAYMSESDWEDFLADPSDVDRNFQPSVTSLHRNNDTSKSEPEENKHKDIQQQRTTTNQMIWCQIEQDPPQFDFLEDCGWQFDS